MPPADSREQGQDAPEAKSSAELDVPREAPRRGSFGCARTFLVCFALLILLAGFVFYRIERMAENGAAEMVNWGARVRDALVSVTGMQPRVTVNEQVVFEEARPALKLVVLERDIVVERETETHWMGSAKRLRIRGLYHVAAGYDLAKSFRVNISGDHAELIRLQMPSPRVLTVEQKDIEILTMENGLWNHLSPDELASEINLLGLEAHLKAQQSDTAAQARRLFLEQLEGKLGPGHRIEIVTPTPASLPAATKQ